METPRPDVGRSSVQRSIPFSSHSRGVYLLEQAEVLDCGATSASAFRQVRDVGSSFITLVITQTWLTVFTVIISICSISFFSYGPADDKFPLDLSYIGFLLILPTLLYLAMGFRRREAALDHLSEVKSGLLFCWMRAEQRRSADDETSEDAAVALQQTMFTLLDAMRIYFLMPRFYAIHYPYVGVRSKMLRIAHEQARQLRQVTACFKKLFASCEGCHAELLAVNLAFEKMSNVKEFRTPQAVRVVARIGIPVIVPVFVGPFWASYYKGTTSFAFALLIGTLLNVILVVLLNAAIQLEDPFDNQGLDGIYVDETFNAIEQSILMDPDAELATASQVQLSAPNSAKMSGQGPWSHEQEQLSPGNAVRTHPRPAHDLNSVSMHDPPLSTEYP